MAIEAARRVRMQVRSKLPSATTCLLATLCSATCSPVPEADARTAASAAVVAAPKTPLPAPCARSFHVDASAAPGGDGSESRPFVALREAFGTGCSLTIAIAGGKYSEASSAPITIDRPTTIVAAGTRANITARFEITADVPVKLQNVRIVPRWPIKGDRKTVYRTTGIRVPIGVAPALELRNVEIAHARGYGLDQAGGTLRAASLEISDTGADLDDPLSGAALRFSNGADAVLSIVHLHDNVRGIYAVGPGTTVDANGLVVEDSASHPALSESLKQHTDPARGYGAIELDREASGTGSLWTIRRGRLAGLHVHHSAKLEVRGLTLQHIDGLDLVAGETVAHGVVAREAGVVDLTDFHIDHVHVCAVMILSQVGSGIDLHHGVIADSGIGACVLAPGYRLSRLNGDRVTFRNNGRDLQGASDFPAPPSSAVPAP